MKNLDVFREPVIDFKPIVFEDKSDKIEELKKKISKRKNDLSDLKVITKELSTEVSNLAEKRAEQDARTLLQREGDQARKN